MPLLNQHTIKPEIGMPVTVYYVSMASVYRVTGISKNGNIITVESHGMTKRFRRPKACHYWTGVAENRCLLAQVGVENPRELMD